MSWATCGDAWAAEPDQNLLADEPAAPADADRGRPVKHARYYWLLLAEGHLSRRLFGKMLNRPAVLPAPGG